MTRHHRISLCVFASDAIRDGQAAPYSFAEFPLRHALKPDARPIGNLITDSFVIQFTA
jgi:hypothetical protein